METVTDFIFLGSKINSGGDCSHEIKRHLLPGRKAMTNLDSILKSRDFTFPAKVHLVKAMVFPGVMYGCESWTIKESWALKNWCFWTVVLEESLESPLDCKEIQHVHPKGDQSWIFTEGLIPKLKLQYFGHLMRRTDSLEKILMLGHWRREEKGMTEVEMTGWHHWLDGHEFEQALGVGDGQGSLVCCSPWGHKESDTTEQLNWTEGIHQTKRCKMWCQKHEMWTVSVKMHSC